MRSNFIITMSSMKPKLRYTLTLSVKCSNRDKYWRKDNLYNRSTNTINQGKKFRKRLTLSGEFKVGIFSHNFSELKNENFEHRPVIEKDLFNEYVKRYSTEKGILLKRVLYGIVAKK